MVEIILGMAGAYLAFAAYRVGYYLGRKSLEKERPIAQEELSEEIKRQREQLAKDINAVFNYKGGRNG